MEMPGPSARLRLAGLLVCGAALGACADSIRPESFTVAMVVDEDTAWIRRSPNEVRLAIHVTVRNEDTRSLYVTPCSHRLQRSASSGWYTVWATPCFPGRLYSLALVPGEATVITIEAHTGVDSSAWPATGEPGLYRVILALTTVPLNVGASSRHR